MNFPKVCLKDFFLHCVFQSVFVNVRMSDIAGLIFELLLENMYIKITMSDTLPR